MAKLGKDAKNAILPNLELPAITNKKLNRGAKPLWYSHNLIHNNL
jgi:hypothetical protein